MNISTGLLEGGWCGIVSSWISASFSNSEIFLLLTGGPLSESGTSGFPYVSFMLANGGITLSSIVEETNFACGNLDATVGPAPP